MAISLATPALTRNRVALRTPADRQPDYLVFSQRLGQHPTTTALDIHSLLLSSVLTLDRRARFPFAFQPTTRTVDVDVIERIAVWRCLHHRSPYRWTYRIPTLPHHSHRYHCIYCMSAMQ